ncbi:MAG: bifunctional ADP-dependent NAD(P)H-hydrate dehydratase/NAD(P)H-hydrate epimerase [Vulcanimicrobiaceae bacterium]
MRVVTAAQMRAADAAAVARVGDVALMRAAGAAIAEAIERVASDPRRVVAFAGRGNNGGDAFAAFAVLDPACERIVHADPIANASPGRLDAQARAAAAGVITRPFPRTADDARAALVDADLALDAMLGVGARTEPSDEFVVAIAALATHPCVLAVDVPTGVDATTGAVAAHAVRAHHTATLGAPKLGLLLEPGRACVGTLYASDLGIAGDVAALDVEASDVGDAPAAATPSRLRRPSRYAMLDDAEFLALLPRRDDESDKRRSGAPLVVAGSPQFPGAAVLCARGAARAGAGYVTVATVAAAASALRAHLVEEIVVAYEPDDVGAAIETLLDLTRRSNAVAIGPGLGLSDRTGEIVRGFLARLQRPFVADASALFHLGKHLDILRGKACVLTPHAGEFARLSGDGTIAPGDRVARLRAFVARTGVTTLLKGSATLIDDGTTMHVTTTGTNALATAGTGDVLSGMIATLLAQGLAPVDAARAAAHWHGLGGREAARERRVGVVAGDVAEALGRALPSPARPRATTARLDRLL